MDNKIVLISEFTQLIKHKSLTFRMKKILTTRTAVTTRILAFQAAISSRSLQTKAIGQ